MVGDKVGAVAATVTVSIDIPASRRRVWEDVVDLAGHVEWMADARSIEFATDARSGVGTVMEEKTRIGPFRTTDLMEVTAWQPGERIAVSHCGLFSGVGEFALADEGDGTRFAWSEQITFPWYFLGDLGARMATPVFSRVWRRNLLALRDRFSAR
ncbi:MAG: SRPBCC family protein [Actinomycetota bacterium]